jgi:predicted dithiol-disulfide oxidoreductase (DUF899 family)
MPTEIERLEKELMEAKKRLSDARRRRTPEPVENYPLTRSDGSATTLHDLFGEKDDLIVIHNMGRSCPYCTLWADGLVGLDDHLSNRAGFVVCTPDPPEVQLEFAASRDWPFEMVSGTGGEFIKDMGFMPEGKAWPGVSAFHRNDDGTVVRTGKAIFGPGDDFCALWHLLDLLPGGPKGWEPKYKYE